jgi:hypothetical protein
VRQVWVVHRISGTEHFRVKGHHGKYVPLTGPPPNNNMRYSHATQVPLLRQDRRPNRRVRRHHPT